MITEGDEQNPLNLGSNFGETFNIWITSFFPGNPTSSLHALTDATDPCNYPLRYDSNICLTLY